ncbi:MAG: serine protease [Granulosicoccaceae bacterium]
MLYRFRHWMLKRAQFTVLLSICATAWAQPTMAADLGVAIIDNTTRIIGGDESSSGQFPFISALVRDGSGSLANRQFCGASIINEKWLLTAAHCMYDGFGNRISNESFKAVVGIINLRTESPMEHVVTNYFIHPGYNNNSEDIANDIALIELATTPSQATVSLFGDDAEALAGYDATVVGWGATDYTDETNPVFPDELRHAVVPIISRGICNAPVSYAGNIADTQICAGLAQGGVDSCVGDSGGPLLIDINGVTAQVGIVSYGNGCAEPLFYGVYTNVGKYVEWIRQYTSVSSVGTPRALEANNGIGGNGGSAGQSTENNASSSGAAWLLLWIMAGVCLRRRR